MHILLTAATPFELGPTINLLRGLAKTTQNNVLFFERVSVEVLFTGVGPAAAAFALGYRLGGENPPQLAIQAGVGGALDKRLNLGDVVRIEADRFGDLGAEAADGSLLGLTEMGLPPGPPFTAGGWLEPAVSAALPYPAVRAITMSRAGGSAATIAARRARYPEAAVETMEGASFFYACMQTGVEPLQLRSISNYVEPRNREAWRMAEAISALNREVEKVLSAFIG